MPRDLSSEQVARLSLLIVVEFDPEVQHTAKVPWHVCARRNDKRVSGY
jgi:hypothetical protein